MPENLPIQGQVDDGRVGGVGRTRSTSGVLHRNGAAFEALLEKLEGQAKRIGESTGDIEKPEELSEAVDRARESLADALSLRDQILEAWRAQQTNARPDESDRD